MRGTYQLGFKGFPQELRLPKTHAGQAFLWWANPAVARIPNNHSETIRQTVISASNCSVCRELATKMNLFFSAKSHSKINVVSMLLAR